ncbi:MAG TPA: histidine phosphatase family protein [Jatrophihabitantaceae bacterium]|nr:histidine phosphatase family protein [Jatrophihabitantaceae bacterium]
MTEHRLVLIRHAKAADGTRDLGRPLTRRGHRDAQAVGALLADHGIVLDEVLVSPARRTVETWEEVAGRLGKAPTVRIDERIYENRVKALLAAIHETAENVRTLAVVGHNPAIGTLANVLAGEHSDASARAVLAQGYPTAGTAVLRYEAGWHELDAGAAELELFAAPRG